MTACSWCDAEAVYLRPYWVRKIRDKREMYACLAHAKALMKIDPGYGYPIRRADERPIHPDEVLRVFGRVQSVHGHHARNAIR